MTQKLNEHKLSWWMVVIHTVFIVLVMGLSYATPDEPNSAIEFKLVMFTFNYIDAPVGLLYEKIIRPMLTGSMTMVYVTALLWFTLLGGLYWFCIGMIVTKVRRRLVNGS